MKVLLVTICAILAISSTQASEALDKMKAEVRSMAVECAKDNGASDDDVNDFMGKIAPESHEAGCMLFCVGKRTGFFDADGKYSESGTKAFFSPLKDSDAALYERLLAIADRCEKEVGSDSDHCATAAHFYQCSLKAEKEMMQ